MSAFSQFDLSKKVAIVTGASKGIGEAIAMQLAAAGAQVVVSSRKLEAVQAVADQINTDQGKASAFAANAGSIEELKALYQYTVDTYGGVDILVNNAAANPVFGPVIKTEEEAFDKIMNVNVKGPFELAKLCYKSMKERGGGSVINISSVGGISPEHYLGIYSVSKAALISLTKVMAKEWGVAGIRANVICPGLIKTKFSEALWSNDQIAEPMIKQLPLPRIGEVDDIRGLALFLAADASAYSTGGVFTADGGYTI